MVGFFLPRATFQNPNSGSHCWPVPGISTPSLWETCLTSWVLGTRPYLQHTETVKEASLGSLTSSQDIRSGRGTQTNWKTVVTTKVSGSPIRTKDNKIHVNVIRKVSKKTSQCYTAYMHKWYQEVCWAIVPFFLAKICKHNLYFRHSHRTGGCLRTLSLCKGIGQGEKGATERRNEGKCPRTLNQAGLHFRWHLSHSHAFWSLRPFLRMTGLPLDDKSG